MNVVELKKEIARKERELDYKLTHLASFADHLEQPSSQREDDEEFDGGAHMKLEIETIISKLRELNRQLSNAGASPTICQQHIGKLQTFNQDYLRIKKRIEEAWQTTQLMRGGRARESEYSDEMHLLMQEQNSVRGSHSAADRVLLQAEAAHRDLEKQRHRVGGVQSRLRNVARAVPGLDSLMTRIRGKREKDRLILAACIGTCVVLIMLYWWYM